VKRFEIVTEADARVLEHGSAILLARRGHITPLAADTLRARRIVVVREGDDVDLASLAPPAKIETVAVAGDHTSLPLKAALLRHLRGRGVTAHDLGTHSTEPVDYPHTASLAATPVSRGECHAAVVIDGSGIGSAIAANKLAGIRAAMCVNPMLARYGREHTGINVLALGSTIVSPDEARAIVDAFLDTPMREPRYIRRLGLIRALERNR